MRLALVAAVAVPLAVADLALKASRATPPWAYHERSLAWLACCAFLLAGLVVVTRIPSALVPPAAGVLAGGVLGNGFSAVANGLEVPNPIVLTGEQSVVAFNLADVWVLLGVVSLVSVLALWLIRNRDVLPPPRRVPEALARALRRS